MEKEQYEQYIKDITPQKKLWLQMLKAFITGGIISLIGQFILNVAMNDFHMDKKIAGSWCSLILILLSVILTGFNVYPKIVKWGGAGALVPITGFANSVAAPAIEYKKEDCDILCTNHKRLGKFPSKLLVLMRSNLAAAIIAFSSSAAN